jgi:hypothetical protein
VHTAHRGWAAPVGSDAWLAARLKAAQPLPAALGTAVHDAATACVRALLACGALPPLPMLREAALQQLAVRWHNARHRLPAFWRRPQDAPVFLEALYAEGPTPEQRAQARAKLDRVLVALLDCYEVWYWVGHTAPEDVVLVDPFARFVLADDVLPAGVPVYAAPDLLVRPAPDAPWHVVDFKTGRADGVVDQVLTYALAAERSLGAGLRLDLRSVPARGVVVALDAPPATRVTTFAISPEDLVDAEARLRGGITAARALLLDPVANVPRALTNVSGPTDPATCRRCAFRGLCFPERFPVTR